MPIQFNCTCGKVLKSRDDLAGKNVKCPGCGKILLVPAPKAPVPPAEPVPKPTGRKIDTTGLEILPPGERIASRPVPKPVPAPTLRRGGEAARTPDESPETLPENVCPKCGAKFYPGDAICITCGAQLADFDEGLKRKRFLRKSPLFQIGLLVLALGLIALVVYLNFFKKAPEGDKDPVVLLKKEVAVPDLTSLEPLAKALAGCQIRALNSLKEGFDKSDRITRLKSTYGMLILAYVGLFNDKNVYFKLDTARRDSDDERREVILDTLYLIAGENPEFSFILRGDEIKKYLSYFKVTKRAPPIHDARNTLKGFLGDDNVLLRVKSTVYLILLGDKNRLDNLAEFLKDKDSRAVAQAQRFLKHLTGEDFPKYEDYDAWKKKPKEDKPKEENK